MNIVTKEWECSFFFQKALFVKGIFSVFFKASVVSTCSEESNVCHWATGLRGLDSISAQWRSWFPVASQPRYILPIASFLLILSWSHTEMTSWTFCMRDNKWNKQLYTLATWRGWNHNVRMILYYNAIFIFSQTQIKPTRIKQSNRDKNHNGFRRWQYTVPLDP